MTQVGALLEHYPRITAQAPGRLAVAHINSVNAAGPVLKQTIAEAASGDAAIKANAPLHGDGEGLKCPHQLFATP